MRRHLFRGELFGNYFRQLSRYCPGVCPVIFLKNLEKLEGS